MCWYVFTYLVAPPIAHPFARPADLRYSLRRRRSIPAILEPTTPLSAWPPLPRFATNAPRRQSPRSVCLAWRPVPAPILMQRERFESCKPRFSYRRTGPPPIRCFCWRLPLTVTTTPAVRSKSNIASCNWLSSTLRSDTTSTVSNSFS